jgi:uncharacterized protein
MDAPQPIEHPSVERIQSLDLLRGVALCGILVMNITSFALPGTAYSNPTAYGDDTFSNHLVFAISYVFFDQKMMGLFSLLFGASAMLFMEKLRHKGLSTIGFYYSRMIWLIIFGLFHSVLLWEGDILFFYGLCGLFLFLFQKMPAASNFLLGLLMFLVAIGVGEYGQSKINEKSPEELSYLSWAWQPTEREVDYEISLRGGSYASLVRYRRDTSELNSTYPTSFLTKIFLTQGILRAFGLMLVGMALFRWDFFRGGNYQSLGKILLATSAVIASLGLWLNYQQQWDITYSLYHGRVYNHLATPIMVLAYALLLVHLGNTTKNWALPWMANYGRMAFTNYLCQSLICTSLFYGYGLGWYAKFDRWQLMLLVGAILLVQMIFSNLWLHFFRYGPLEWFWRLCTFFRLP